MISKVYSAQPRGLSAELVCVEVDVSRGLNSVSIIGLPDKAVEESRNRILSAIQHIGNGIPSPKGKIIISLAPADLKKEGALFDLPIALAYLKRGGIFTFDEKKVGFIGELSLDGTIYPVRGVLPVVSYLQSEGYKDVYVPYGNKEEAALIRGINVYGVRTLSGVVEHLKGTTRMEVVGHTSISDTEEKKEEGITFDDIRGQEYAKRGLIIAAAGGHNIAFYGPPGTGKTLLARSLIHILPPLTEEEVVGVTGIHSVAGTLKGKRVITKPPFIAPHHTASHTAIVGGGTPIMPGCISLAHKGILFLDEFPEFDRRVIESLREPLEEKTINISRARQSLTFPADCIVVVAMNPTPHGSDEVTIDPLREARYKRKISGPVMERIDMWVRVDTVSLTELAKQKNKSREETEKAQELVKKARLLQHKRYKGTPSISKNADLSARTINDFSYITKEAEEILQRAGVRYSFSPRSYHRVLKLGRTVADIEGSKNIEETHILEALQYKTNSLNV